MNMLKFKNQKCFKLAEMARKLVANDFLDFLTLTEVLLEVKNEKNPEFHKLPEVFMKCPTYATVL